MNEARQAQKIANMWLDFNMDPLTQLVPGDPDCDACVLARQYLRSTTMWRPIAIEPAPKDKIVLLWAATDISDVGEIKNWKMETGYWAQSHNSWIWGGTLIRKIYIQPTHWMPLPAAPSDIEVMGGRL
jgi:hypothetical protein